MKGPRGQFRSDTANSFVHAENFLVERDGSLRNRPALNQTSTAGITILDTDKFLPIEANDTTYYLVYDPLLFIEWEDSGTRLPVPPSPGLTSTLLFNNDDYANAYIDDEFALFPTRGGSTERAAITAQKTLLRSRPSLALLKNRDAVRSQYGLGLDLNSLEDYNTWLQLGYTQESIAENYNKMVNFGTWNYLDKLRPKALDIEEHQKEAFLSSVRSASDIAQMFGKYSPIITLPRINKSSLFWNRFILYDREGNILTHYVRRFMFTDENKNFEGTPEEFEFPTGNNILDARNNILRDHPQWQNLEYSVAPTSGEYQILVESTGRLPTLLIDIQTIDGQERADIFDPRILYLNNYGATGSTIERGARIFTSYLTENEAQNIDFGVRSGNIPSTITNAPISVSTAFIADLASADKAIITSPESSREQLGTGNIIGQPAGNALFASTDSFIGNTSPQRESDPYEGGMELWGSPLISKDSAFITQNGGVAYSPFFNGLPLVGWHYANIFTDLLGGFPSGNRLRERNNLIRESPLYGQRTSISRLSGRFEGNELLVPNNVSSAGSYQASGLSFMNPVYGLNTVRIPIHGGYTLTTMPFLFSPLMNIPTPPTFGAVPIRYETGISFADRIATDSSGNAINNARRIISLSSDGSTGADNDRVGTFWFIIIIGRKYLKATYRPWATAIPQSELNLYLRGFFSGGAPRKEDAILFSDTPPSTGSRGQGTIASFLSGLALPGYNSNNYFRHASHFGGRYVFGGTRTQPNLVAATHAPMGDDNYFTSNRTKFLSFDSYSRFSTGGSALTLDGFRLRLTPVGGASILRFVVLATPPRLRVITSQGEAEFTALTLQAVSMAQFTEQEAVSSNPIVNTYTANYQVTLDAFVVNLIQGSEELKRDRYVPVSNPFPDNPNTPNTCLLYTSPSPRD